MGWRSGLRHPSCGYFVDNGDEFLNDDLIDFVGAYNITIMMTAESSPWMNGSFERKYATVDKIMEKLMEDEPKLGFRRQ